MSFRSQGEPALQWVGMTWHFACHSRKNAGTVFERMREIFCPASRLSFRANARNLLLAKHSISLLEVHSSKRQIDVLSGMTSCTFRLYPGIQPGDITSCFLFRLWGGLYLGPLKGARYNPPHPRKVQETSLAGGKVCSILHLVLTLILILILVPFLLLQLFHF